jgi:hypothetical protein
LKESCLNPVDGIHCRLFIGTVQTVGDVWDWVLNVYFHDLQYAANDNTKTVVYSRLWSLAIGGTGKDTHVHEAGSCNVRFQ